MKLLIHFLLFLLIFYLSACSSNNNSDLKEAINISPELIYAEALNEFDNKNYDLAIEKFEEVESKFPLSNEAIQSQIMIAFINYILLEYDLAILKLESIIKRYPSHKNIDYVYYMKAMCYYEQIKNPELDGKFNVLALQDFEEIINRFPDSEYAKDSQQKFILTKENVAAKHMNIGMYYLNQKKYLASIKRYQKVVDEHSQSKFIPEALHRLVEIYYTLGMIEDAKKTASVLGYKYPNSIWNKYSYQIVGEKESKILEKNSLFKIIKNKISFNDEKK